MRDLLGARSTQRLALGLLLALPLAWPPLDPPAQDGEIRLLAVDGVISPVSARYLLRELDAAAEAGAGLVVLRLDTPGGLETAMREMVGAILASPVPVLVYVAPAGARAASAGMFITLAAHMAAMAPGTSIGAAHPVALGGELDPVAAEKIAMDAAAFARSLAELRGRNEEWAERAVLESVSVSGSEALELRVIEIVAPDLDALLAAVDGRTVVTTAGEITIRGVGVPVAERRMPLTERILQTITDPNIAYILFTLGVIGIIAELYNPGMLFPGLTGVISLILAFVAFGSLPVSWAGLVLLVLGIGLLVAELYTETMGVLGVAGVIAFILGSLMLYVPFTPPSPALPQARVSPWLIAVMAALLAALLGVVLRALVQARREPVTSGPQALVGRTARALTELAPEGRIRIEGEEWTALAEDGPVPAGATVRIVRVRGVLLHVRAEAPGET